MKFFIWILLIAAVLVFAYYAFGGINRENNPPTDDMDESAMQIAPIEHATFVLTWGDTVFYIDPVGTPAAFAGQPAPDVILVTDIHQDHFSTSTLAAIAGDADLIVPQAVADELPDALRASATVVGNGELTERGGFDIRAIPMYNLPEATNSQYHVKGRGNGYVITRGDFDVYVAGDTAGTPEMRALTNIDIAFVPMNLPYTMDVDEAADAVLAFAPKQVYPYHYRGQDGLSDVNRFKSLVDAGDKDIEVILLDWYPNQ